MALAAHTLPHRLQLTAQREAAFRVFRDDDGWWCAESADGMTGGTFGDQDSAIRFALRESVGFPVLVLRIELETPNLSK
jgi:hypothetical protein